MLSVLNKLKIRTGSVVWAVQDVNEYYIYSTKSQYEELILRVTGIAVTTADTLTAEIVFKYIVQSVVTGLLANNTLDMLAIVEEAVVNADKIIEENGSIMRLCRPVEVTTEDSNGVKTTKLGSNKSGGSKSAQANSICDKHRLLLKPAVIEILVAEMNISKQNASVYYYKWNKSQE